MTTCLPPGAPTGPTFKVPAGSCDCHAHVLGPFDRYPLAVERPYNPPEAPLGQLKQMLAAMGLDRVVIAHVSAHGFDLDVTLDAMAALGTNARGVAMLRSDVTDARLAELDGLGMRGVRLSMAYGSETPLDEHHLRLWAERIAPYGWHIAMWPGSIQELKLLQRLSETLPVALVLDHLASHAWFTDGSTRADGLAVLGDLLASGRAWLKLSGMYRAGAGSAPWSRLVAPMADIAQRHIGRMLWASDWPYVGLEDPAIRPSSGDLLAWLQILGLDEKQRQQILVNNPQALYRFGPL